MTEEKDVRMAPAVDSGDDAIARMMFGKNVELVTKTVKPLLARFGLESEESTKP